MEDLALKVLKVVQLEPVGEFAYIKVVFDSDKVPEAMYVGKYEEALSYVDEEVIVSFT